MFPTGRTSRPVLFCSARLFLVRGAGSGPLFAGRAEGFVLAGLAPIAEFRWEPPRADVGGGFLNLLAQLIERLVVASRAHGLVVLQVVEREPRGVPVECLSGG